MTPYLDDGDFTLYVGDALTVLRGLPDGHVNCCLTSPPYWALRDYDVDGQLGLEPTPDAYVDGIVEVFREVRRVLRDDGTLWLNLGDTYFGDSPARKRSSEAFSETWDPALTASRGGNRRSAGRHGDLRPKMLTGIPWMVAFALRADGWYLRADIIWHKLNPMPSSVKDRPTTSHEYLFLLTKKPRYYYDGEAIAEPAEWARWGDQTIIKEQQGTAKWIQPKPKTELVKRRTVREGIDVNGGGQGSGEIVSGLTRNARSVWPIPTQPYPDAHFATFPEELVRRVVLAGCPEFVCRTCGSPRERITERVDQGYDGSRYGERAVTATGGAATGGTARSTLGSSNGRLTGGSETVGWTDCGHNNYERGVMLDPFIGSGTTALVARSLGRRTIGIELNPEYAKQVAKRTQQLSLLT